MARINPITRRLAARPAQFLADMVDNRRRCPARGCERGMVSIVIERASRWYPGAAEDRPCEYCGGLGYLPRRPYRRALGGAA